jgi:hypothetical protein
MRVLLNEEVNVVMISGGSRELPVIESDYQKPSKRVMATETIS